MNKVTESQIKDYVSEVGDFEKEHRKSSSFYCWTSHTFTQADIDEFKEEGFDASDFLGVHVEMSGTWSDDWGTEWDDIDYSKVEEYQELVPEKIIPEHYITKVKQKPFVPVWE